MVQVTILFFARAREIAQTSSQTLSISETDATIAGVRAALITAIPELASALPSAVFALNLNYVAVNDEARTSVREGDEIAVIPPISGG